MARSLVAIQSVTPAGMFPTLTAAAAAGHMFDNSERVFVFVRNASAGATTVTIPSTFARDGLTLPNRTVSVPASEDRLIGPVNGELHNQPSGADIGRTYVDISPITSVSFAVLRV